ALLRALCVGRTPPVTLAGWSTSSPAPRPRRRWCLSCSAIPLALAVSEPWQNSILAGAAALLLVLRRGVVITLLSAAALGALIATAGATSAKVTGSDASHASAGRGGR